MYHVHLYVLRHMAVQVRYVTSSRRVALVTCQMDTCPASPVTMNQAVFAVRWWAVQSAHPVCWISCLSLESAVNMSFLQQLSHKSKRLWQI